MHNDADTVLFQAGQSVSIQKLTSYTVNQKQKHT
jgi:hypothetical protein